MGKVYLVGAGPGDPDLITVKGLKAIQRADVILYDRLVNQSLLEEAKLGAELVYCGKLPNHHTMKQEAINEALVSYAKRGRTIVRLKGGDPFLFGRGGEEAEVLAANRIPFEIVPGITAGMAAPSYAGIPMTHREASASVAFVTGHRREGEDHHKKWKHLAQGVDTLAIYMGVSELPTISQLLLEHGRPASTPVAVIHWGTTEMQETLVGTLETIAQDVEESSIMNPSMIVVGEVVAYRERIKWFEQLKPAQEISTAQ
ncbi:uroporphyrin-III C-methyltransferase [Pontibacillus halophilus JSM 076056 = DSM 19796]|uniref:Uroporphyrinogen-III C-methyltransferase n=1 Tax=Pontibacillus halophilus JSM 076056 = DSM 19796 TaxID=1385510 RepID=A0A0A5GP77_9BACI|nr:uroporphyrinogen-III C-methyltransferase [Pontibacillus halophilus]KGX92970.1 uroporphyrin-III C-methyltransferase [Pontibacillus halophilus JSM 076056 = DSM 19796]